MEKIRAGADLVQLYSCMIYSGPGLPAKILHNMSAILDREGAASLADLKGSRTDQWASLAL